MQVFPETAHIVEPVTTPQSSDAVTGVAASGKPSTQVWSNGVWTGHFPLSTQRESAPANLPLVLVFGKESLRTVSTISGTWPALGSGASAVPITTGILEQPRPIGTQSVGDTGLGAWGLGAWGLALLAALVGGVILNLMPCVLPVLAIKVLGFACHSEHSRASQRAQGLAYTAGVVLSFVALGALMLGLRASGEQLGWGFHMQSPAVLAVLATLFTLLGLNLAGVFEIGSVLPHRVASLQARHPVVDAFLSGVLAVAIASPCTAPFMGASLGYAVSLPAVQALGIFAALGLGLALPFLAAAWVPAVGNWLPRPGAWMDTFRRFMAFPMFATVVWLVWVLGQQSGMDGAGALLAILLMLCMLLWALTLHGKAKFYFAIFSIAVLAYITPAIGVYIIKTVDVPTATVQADERWQNWEPGRVDQLLAKGQPVFVDFTAAWCVTCQFNKKSTLSKPELLAEFDAKKVQLLRADWTRRDPAIGAALKDLGRSGVPVYVLYAPGKAPQVLSEIISVDDVRAALGKI